MKILTISRKLLAFLSVAILFAFTIKDDGMGELLSRLQQLAAQAPQEKVHLHFDKPYYSLGEDIWFKAYVVDAKQNYLSGKSRILYVDLVDERDSVKQTILLPLVNGTANGNIHLNDSLLAAGNYHLFAYTKWMQNFGSEYFFRKDIAVVNALKNGSNTVAQRKDKALAAVADVQFFPEGGHLVAGIRTKVGFKALKPDGWGEDISGYVVEDGVNEHLAEFHSEHAGMGVFALMPAAGKNYRAVIKHADGSEKRYPLPKADENGYVLNVNHVGDSLSVRVSASANLADGREVALIAQCNGIVQFAAKTKMDKTSNLSYIPLNKFQTGIIQFTLFSPDNLPVAERLVFVDHHDGLTANIKPDKIEYTKREKVNIAFDMADAKSRPVVGLFSVAVTDESKVKADEDGETSILSNLLLTSDMKGYIEQPNYYFNPNNPDRQKHLDQLLLTQGWRRFNWNDLLANKFPLIKYQPEKSLEVSGRVTTLGNNPVAKGKVTLFAKTNKGIILTDTLTDESGRFVFDNLDFTDSSKLIVHAVNAKNNRYVKALIDEKKRMQYPAISFASAETVKGMNLAEYTKATQQQFEELSKYGLMKNAITLKEVKITAPKEYDKFTQAKIIPHSSNLDPGHADYVIKADKLEHETHLLDAFYNIPGIHVNISQGVVYSTRAENSLKAHKPMSVILDGVVVDGAKVMAGIIPADIEGVEFLTGTSKTIYGADGAQGVIIITTKRGGDYQPPPPVNAAHYTPQGYSLVKEFYSPAYDTPSQTTMADLRSTIYWNPDIVTDAQGKANISFYNADGTGTYKVTLEGMDTKGGLVRKVFTYAVK